MQSNRLSRIVLVAAGLSLSVTVFAQRRNAPAADTSRPTAPSTMTPFRTSSPKPYKEVITSKAVSDEGLFTVHKIEDKYFFEINDSIWGRDILVVNRISKSAADLRNGFSGYPGDQIGQNVVRFEKGPNNKVFLRSVSYSEYAKDSSSPMFQAVMNSNIQPIVASFDIKSLSTNSNGTVIEVTDYLAADNDILGFSAANKSSLRLGSAQTDKSYIVSARSYPINIEITTVKTYSRVPGMAESGGGRGGSGGAGRLNVGGNATVELNSSWVILPAKPMQPRYYDPRVGYFGMSYLDFDANPQGVQSVRVIKRWRLEPKPEDMEKYKRGELVEPQKQIVFYIDPATPKKWVPYLIQGINDWNKAFEKAGFKNAIVGKEAPTKEQDPEWSLEDARYSAIVYKPSDVSNAYGPSIADPRSGEIMESHIGWFHNVMQLIRDWYFVQASPNDAAARKMLFDDELMGQLIRFVSSHEVGHTLGLPHNYGSSSTVPVELLRNKKWVEEHGHTPSIMDYARFNYVAQPEDNIGRAGLFPRIGDYDDWSIEWGYRLLPQFNSAEAEKEYLNKWIIEKLKNRYLWFGRETNPDDPRSQREAVGDDAMKASEYGIKNLQRIIPNLEAWTKEPNKDYDNLRVMYNQVRGQFAMYMSHVTKYIGGITETYKTVEEGGAVYENVAKAKQKEAVAFLQRQLFTTPKWLLNKSIFEKTGASGPATIQTIQENTLSTILDDRNLNKLIEAQAMDGATAYTVTELLNDLKAGIWSELNTRAPIDVYRRNLQRSYINVLDKLLNPAPVTNLQGFGNSTDYVGKTDIGAIVRGHLTALKNQAKLVAAGAGDDLTRYHLQDMVRLIDKALDPSK